MRSLATVGLDALYQVLIEQLGKDAADDVMTAVTAAAQPPGPAEPPHLVWHSAGTTEPGDQQADSVMRVHPESTSAHYAVGPAYASPGADGERWSLELVQIRDGERVAATDLGIHATEQDAKDRAQRWEAESLVECTWRTVVEHWARIPLSELMAAAYEETDPEEYVTPDAQLTWHVFTGAADGAFSDLLGRYEPTPDQRPIATRWGSDEDDLGSWDE